MRTPDWLARLRAKTAPSEMSFLDHLEELRGVLLSCIAALLLLAVGGWFVSAFVLDFLVQHTVGQAQFIKPLEAFTTRVKLALLLGFIVGLPFIAFRIWSFVVPGLLHHEKRVVLPLVLWSCLLFLAGVAFSALLLSPTMLNIMLSFGTEKIQADIAIGFLLDFFVKMAFACGMLFQLPLVIAVLSYFELVTPEFLTSKWRHAIVIILIIAAVVTPGDGPSQMVLAVPVILLYFVSIWISRAIWRGKRERAEAEEREEEGVEREEDEDRDEDSEEREEETADEGEAAGAGDGEEDRQGGAEASGEKRRDDLPEETDAKGSPESDSETRREGPGESDRAPQRPRRDGEPRPLHPPDGDYSI